MFSLLNEDPHTTFFCTPQDAGVVKDARVWVTSNKLPTVKKQLFFLQFDPLWIGPSIESSVVSYSIKRHIFYNKIKAASGDIVIGRNWEEILTYARDLRS